MVNKKLNPVSMKRKKEQKDGNEVPNGERACHEERNSS